ncbi:phosphocarrier protein HPr [Niallia endozanthoxylica]|uniref:Phosphocarrier protein HPr n=2 Tax=Niallia endozanthoxylica TaxID=2036016 RepID=A0A5J5HXB4_9BACI|nr:phosphocarrier protein HPr [Niallia endozanthoxylica]
MEKTFTITAKSGIHARPATVIVGLASRFDSDIHLEFKERTVDLKSIMGVMSLGIGQGAEIKVSVVGEDEQEALNALQNLLHKEGLAK